MGRSATRGADALADLGERIAVTRVAGEEDVTGVMAHDEASPERAIAVAWTAAGEVLHGDRVDGRDADGGRLPPVDLDAARDALLLEECDVPEAGDDRHLVRLGETTQRLDAEVVVVVVADENHVDRRQILEAQSWWSKALGSCELDGAGALGPDRVVKKFKPAICTSTVAWPTNETRSVSPSTRSGGGRPGSASTRRHGPCFRVRSQRNTPVEWLCEPSPRGLMKRFPSKWSDSGPLYPGALKRARQESCDSPTLRASARVLACVQ